MRLLGTSLQCVSPHGVKRDLPEFSPNLYESHVEWTAGAVGWWRAGVLTCVCVCWRIIIINRFASENHRRDVITTRDVCLCVPWLCLGFAGVRSRWWCGCCCGGCWWCSIIVRAKSFFCCCPKPSDSVEIVCYFSGRRIINDFRERKSLFLRRLDLEADYEWTTGVMWVCVVWPRSAFCSLYTLFLRTLYNVIKLYFISLLIWQYSKRRFLVK